MKFGEFLEEIKKQLAEIGVVKKEAVDMVEFLKKGWHKLEPSETSLILSQMLEQINKLLEQNGKFEDRYQDLRNRLTRDYVVFVEQSTEKQSKLINRALYIMAFGLIALSAVIIMGLFGLDSFIQIFNQI